MFAIATVGVPTTRRLALLRPGPKQVAFVIPPDVAWPLPGYELALMTAWDARGKRIDKLARRLETPSPTTSPHRRRPHPRAPAARARADTRAWLERD